MRRPKLGNTCPAVSKCFMEVKWMIQGSKHLMITYTGHDALKSIFATGQTEKVRIALWLDQSGKSNIEVRHRALRD